MLASGRSSLLSEPGNIPPAYLVIHPIGRSRPIYPIGGKQGTRAGQRKGIAGARLPWLADPAIPALFLPIGNGHKKHESQVIGLALRTDTYKNNILCFQYFVPRIGHNNWILNANAALISVGNFNLIRCVNQQPQG